MREVEITMDMTLNRIEWRRKTLVDRGKSFQGDHSVNWNLQPKNAIIIVCSCRHSLLKLLLMTYSVATCLLFWVVFSHMTTYACR